MKHTKQFRQKFISLTDPELNYETIECFIDPDNVTFSEFYNSYQVLHKAKYGKELIINE